MSISKLTFFLFAFLSFYCSSAQNWEEPDPLYILLCLDEKYVEKYSIGKDNDRASFAIYVNGFESETKRKKSIANYNKKIKFYSTDMSVEPLRYPEFSVGFLSLEKPETMDNIDKIKTISAKEFSSTKNVKITNPTFIICRQANGTFLKWKVFISNVKE